MLERWDFGWEADRLLEEVPRAAAALRGPVSPPGEMLRRAREILAGFLSSPAAAELRRAELLGREVPLLAASGWRAVAARADVVFRMDGKLVVGDYKLAEEPRVPAESARAYREAASAAFGEPARFALISLTGGRIFDF